jgi:hypothetical protein
MEAPMTTNQHGYWDWIDDGAGRVQTFWVEEEAPTPQLPSAPGLLDDLEF